MGKIEQATIDRILEATDIVDVVGEFVELKRKGPRYWGLCPFHDDRHLGSFVVYPKKQCFVCFACEKKGGAVDFMMLHKGLSYPDAIRWLGQRKGIDVDDRNVSINYTPRAVPPPLPTLYLPASMVWHSMARRCNFHTWIHSVPWTSEMAKRVEPVLEAYKVGATKQGFVLFWQIDDTDTARTGHAMKYKDNGHRYKKEECSWCQDWIPTMLRREVLKDEKGNPIVDADGIPIPKFPQYDDDVVEVRYCPFGLHLLNKYPNAEVHIVESEKTALVAAIYFGEPEKHLWMASAGMYNLTAERLKPIIDQRRTIALHPDKDGTDKWRKKIEEIGYNRAYINDAILALRWKPEDGPKADIADVLLRELAERQRAQRIKKITDIMPAAGLLAEKLDLEIIDENAKQ